MRQAISQLKCQPRAVRWHPNDKRSSFRSFVIKLAGRSPYLFSRSKAMTLTLDGKRVAILATDGFEQSELLEPRKALDEAGAETSVVSPTAKKIKGWNHKDWGNEVPVDI